MAIINQSIPFQATGGGSVSVTAANASWVKMNDNRFVVVYPQTNPVGRRFMIIDNPDGINSETPPTVTNAVIAVNDTNVPSDFYSARLLKLVKVNANAFVCVWKASSTNSNLQFEYFSILGTTITRLTSAAYSLSGVWGGNSNLLMNDSTGYSAFQRPVIAVNTANNETTFCFFKEARYLSRGNQYQHYQVNVTVKATFNPANNGVSFGNPDYQGVSGGGQADTYLSLYVDGGISVPFRYPDYYETMVAGTDTPYVGYRLINNNTTITDRSSGVLSHFHNSFNGSNWQSNSTPYDTCYLKTTRRVQAGWNSAHFFDAIGNRADGGAIYTPPVSPAGDDAATFPYVLPINADWFIVLDSRHFYNINLPINMKVVCREDFNILSPSTASQSQYGISINPAVKIQMFQDNFRPFMLRQDLMWCGKIVGDTGKFSYNIIKQPPLSN